MIKHKYFYKSLNNYLIKVDLSEKREWFSDLLILNFYLLLTLR